MLTLSTVALYHGPNPFSEDPVLVSRLVCTDGEWSRYGAAITRLSEASSDWYLPQHGRAQPAELALGTFLADWSLQALTFVRGYLLANGCAKETGGENLLIWIGWHDAAIAQATLATAVRLLEKAASREPSREVVQKEVVQIWQAIGDRHPDYQARIVMEAARPRGIAYAPVWGMPRYWRFGEGTRSRVLFESSSTRDSLFGGRIAASKSLSKTVLRNLGIPTPAFCLVKSEAEVAEAAQAVGFPCVTKPIDRGGGKGVSAGLQSIEVAQSGFRAAREVSPGPVLVEAHLEGEDHRLMVVEGRLVAAIRREPPSVTGDGQSTIKELVAAKNIGRSGYFRPIRFDASALLHLAGQALQPETVLQKGQVIRLRSNGNLSTGGDCIDVTRVVHPDIQGLVESLAETLGIAMLGADYMTTDISRSPHELAGSFVEINTCPGLDAMIAAGWPTEKAGALALSPDMGAVPKTLIVAQADRFNRLVSAARKARWPVGTGWASRGEATVSGAALRVPDGQGWTGVEMLLGHRAVGRAILFASDRDILRLGMPVAKVDHLVLAAHLPAAWTQVLSSKSAVAETPGPIAEPEDLIERLMARLADHDLSKEGVLA
jgi:cyanophycin synthetase